MENIFVLSIRYFIPPFFSILFRVFGLGYKDKKHMRIGMIIFFLYMLIVPFTLISIMGYYTYTRIAFIVLTIGNLAVFYISCDGFLKTAFLLLTQVNMVFLLTILCSCAKHILNLTDEILLPVLFVVFLASYIISMKYFVKPLRFMADNIQSVWGMLLLIPIITIVLGLFVTVYSGVYFGNQTIYASVVVAMIEICFFLYVGILYKNLSVITALASEKTDNELLKLYAQSMEIQIELIEKEYKLSMQNVEEIRRMRHDMNHHLTAISTYINAHSNIEAQKYIEEVITQIPDKPISDKNLLTASFISRYSQLCKESDIRFTYDVELNEELVEDKIALGTLLGNALQNAYEAAILTEGDNRYIYITCKRFHSNIVLTVKNSYNGRVNKDYKTMKSGELHGLGLLSMKKTVEEHDGYMEITHTDKEFTLVLTMKYKN